MKNLKKLILKLLYQTILNKPKIRIKLRPIYRYYWRHADRANQPIMYGYFRTEGDWIIQAIR